jgi:hypothetical protein
VGLWLNLADSGMRCEEVLEQAPSQGFMQAEVQAGAH